jgi:GNAT superfamily N-acetyltransferase
MNYIIPKRSLEDLSSSGYGRSTVPFVPSEEDVLSSLEKFSENVEEAASRDAVLRVFRHNPQSIIMFRHVRSGETGFVAILPLNVAGHIALADDTLSTGDPQLEYVCPAGKAPHSVYVWGIGISHRTAGGIAHVMDFLSQPEFVGATLYCKAANAKAEKLFLSLGFTKGAMMHGTWRPDLMEFARAESHRLDQKDDNATPLYDSYRRETATAGAIGIKLVHNIQELTQVLMIRGASYLGEQNIPWSEDVDGNDFCAAHLIGYVGNEPASCVRVRFFSGFVKLERLAVLPQYRSTPIATRTVRAAIEYARAKGYCRFYGQTERSVFPIWRRFGFALRPEKGLQYMTEREYVEGDMVTSPAPNPITPRSGGYVLLRPEGQWHRKSDFEAGTASACSL